MMLDRTSRGPPPMIALCSLRFVVRALRALALCFLLLPANLIAADPEPKAPDNKQVNDKIKEIAGRAEVLKAVRKHFGTLKAVDLARHRVTLLLEGESLPKIWE